VLAALPAVCYLPTHLILNRVFKRRANVIETLTVGGAASEVLTK
jgi:hypothetical protein